VEFDDRMFSDYGNYEARVRMGDLHIPFIEPEDALLNSLNHFAECINTGATSRSGPDQAIRVLKVLSAADQKLRA